MSGKTPMSNRQTTQDGEKIPESRAAPDFSKFMVCDSYSNPITNHISPSGGGEESAPNPT